MKRLLIVGLILFGAMLLPASATAAEVSPSKQAQLDQYGWTVVDESESLVTEAGLSECRHGAAKRIASGIWYGDDLQVRGRLKMAACAANGKITKFWTDYSHTAAGRHWRRSWGPYVERWKGKHSAGVRSKIMWAFDGVITQWWTQALRLTFHVKGDHKIWIEVKRRWF